MLLGPENHPQGVFGSENGWDRRNKTRRNPKIGPRKLETMLIRPRPSSHSFTNTIVCLAPKIAPRASFGLKIGGIDAENWEESENMIPNPPKNDKTKY